MEALPRQLSNEYRPQRHHRAERHGQKPFCREENRHDFSLVGSQYGENSCLLAESSQKHDCCIKQELSVATSHDVRWRLMLCIESTEFLYRVLKSLKSQKVEHKFSEERVHVLGRLPKPIPQLPHDLN